MLQSNNKTIVDSRLRSPCLTHGGYFTGLITEQNLVGLSAVMLVVFDRRLGIHDMP